MPQQEISTGEVYRKLEDMDARHSAAFTSIHVRLDTLNGRTRANEVAIAVLRWGFGLGGAIGLVVFVAFLQHIWR